MSVIVKGMQMPPTCSECRMRTDYDFCSAMPKEFCGYTNDIRRPEWCPLVELPEKHGRLIDAAELLERFLSVDRTVSFGASGLYVDIHDLYKILSSLPTVIEAEGE